MQNIAKKSRIATNSIWCFSGGLCNRIYVCENLSDDHPSKVLIKLYGGKLIGPDVPYRTLTEAGEVLVCYTMGELGLGPKLFGVFKGGRIEEYISVSIA